MKQIATFGLVLWMCSSLQGNEAAAGELSQKDVERVLKAHYPEVKNCYLRHAGQQESASGRVKLTMVVSREGRVRRKALKVDAPGVKGEKFSRCVTTNAAAWRFPELDYPTEVQYPLLFVKTHSRGAGPS